MKSFTVAYFVTCEGEFTVKAEDEDIAREVVEDMDYDELAQNSEDITLEIKGISEDGEG